MCVFVYIYIYIYMCVCVCVCGNVPSLQNFAEDVIHCKNINIIITVCGFVCSPVVCCGFN